MLDNRMQGIEGLGPTHSSTPHILPHPCATPITPPTHTHTAHPACPTLPTPIPTPCAPHLHPHPTPPAGANYRSVWAMHKHFPGVKTFVRAFDIASGERGPGWGGHAMSGAAAPPLLNDRISSHAHST